SWVATGTEGSVAYDVEGVAEFTISWDNPFVGSNSGDQFVAGPRQNRYVSALISGNGNHSQMRYLIGNQPTPFSVRQILGKASGADLSHGLRQLMPGTMHPPVSLR